MENKDLLGSDWKLEGPKSNYIYFSSTEGIDHLNELAVVLHAEKVELIDAEANCSIVYNKHKNQLECNGCAIDLYYPKRYKKIKIGGETYA